jgi:hypothetical protein
MLPANNNICLALWIDIGSPTSCIQMSKVGAEAVAKLKSLLWLETAGGYLDDHGLQALAPLAEGLTYLSIAQNKHITDAAWGSLVQFRLLRQLNISQTGMSVPNTEFIAKLPALRELSMHGIKGANVHAEALSEDFPALNVSCRELCSKRR